MEERIIELVIKVCVEGAYCCKLANIRFGDTEMRARITMRCQRHLGYSFDMDCKMRDETPHHDFVLMREIGKGIVDGQLNARRAMDLYHSLANRAE